MNKGRIIVAIMAFIISCVMPGLAEAATRYVRAGAAGNGSDWANALGQLPAALVRGDTYYIAAGSYASHTFNDALSGSTFIYIKKATVADHGTDTGWNASYAGTATFGAFTFSKGYYDIDGKVGGGPGSWTSGHGFKITTAASGTGKVITINNVTSIRIRHAEIYFNNLVGAATTTATGDLIYAIAGGSDLLVQYCWLHDSARTIFYPITWSNVTFEYSRMERNGINWSSGNHSEIFSARQVTNVTVRYSYILDWKSTGGLIFGGVSVNVSPAKSTSSNIYIYGNIFEWTKNWGNTANDGAIGSWNHAWMAVQNVRIYNNTFVNITDSDPSDASSIFPIVAGLSDVMIQNNLWYNSNPRIINGSHNYNWFSGGGAHGEANAQVSSSSPFINYAAKDYRLSSATQGVNTLSSPYNTDMTGKLRGQDGNWDRGAYEFAGASVITLVPSAPMGLTVN